MSALPVKVPSIGDFKDVPVIEVFVKPGDTVKADDPLITLESDKATMDVPSPAAGTVRELSVKTGDRVSEGSVIALLETLSEDAARPAEPTRPPASSQSTVPAQDDSGPPERKAAGLEPRERSIDPTDGRAPHGSPSVRRFSRELGVNLALVTGSGPKGRILVEDVQRFVKGAMGRPAQGGLALAPWPDVDFARFGPIRTEPLSRIQKLSKTNLARNWVLIPHVTQFDEADITDLERFRVELNEENAQAGLKVTLLAFLVKACVATLERFPTVNGSIVGDDLVLKRYFHIGFAADTPQGLVVPVVKDADKKGLLEIAKELSDLAAKARTGKLGPADMQGGCFTISSLGGIGGTAFTPIINAPEVAILGVSRSAMRPVWDGERFSPRLMLPLSFSYDHRVIDGALAARFTTYLGKVLGDMRRAIL